MTKIKLQPGDYVSTEGMTEEQYHAVCRAFMDAGAEKNEYGLIDKDTCNCVGWSNYGIFHGMDLCHPDWDGEFDRKLTIQQILGQEEKKMDINEAYKVMQANCGIEVGDTVIVLRKFDSKENGSYVYWDKLMHRRVGKEGVVNEVYDDGNAACINICFEDKTKWSFPFFVLGLVKKGKKLPEAIRISSQYHASFREDGGIVVGCQNIDFETLEKVYLTAKGVINND